MYIEMKVKKRRGKEDESKWRGKEGSRREGRDRKNMIEKRCMGGKQFEKGKERLGRLFNIELREKTRRGKDEIKWRKRK